MKMYVSELSRSSLIKTEIMGKLWSTRTVPIKDGSESVSHKSGVPYSLSVAFKDLHKAVRLTMLNQTSRLSRLISRC